MQRIKLNSKKGLTFLRRNFNSKPSKLSNFEITKTAQKYIDLENKHGAHNYAPLPVVLNKGRGVYVHDVDHKMYIDCLGAYSAVNQGHVSKNIRYAALQQMEKLCLTSRAFYNDVLGSFEEYITKIFKYDKILPMNTGVEACETAVKLCRRWGYDVKKIPENKARIIFAEGNFWGRSIAAVSSSTDPESYGGFGPFVPNFDIIPYDNLNALEKKLKDKNVAGFMVEPIQGEAGVRIPTKGYLTKVRELCTKYNVLMIADEVQTGLGRTGKMLCCDHENVRPDILVLGKALSGGFYPVSAALADDEIMLCIKRGQHGSTYGGNPLGAAIARSAVDQIIENDLCQKSNRNGEIFRQKLNRLKSPLIKEIRGVGLMNAIEINDSFGVSAKDICLELVHNGVLAKPTHNKIIRFTPPLVITASEIQSVVTSLEKSLKHLEKQVGITDKY